MCGAVFLCESVGARTQRGFLYRVSVKPSPRIDSKRLITARDKRQPRDLVRDPSVQSVEEPSL